MVRVFFLSLLFLMITFMAEAQKEIPLYEKVVNSRASENKEKAEIGADGITRISNVSVPTLTVFEPAAQRKKRGAAVIICPGGGYRILAFTHEGIDVAKKLNEWGVTAFVLKYRLPDDAIMEDKSIAPLQDAERAIQWVREHAKEYHLDPARIGIMGFSAGGHLAASLSTRYTESLIENKRKTSLRPDFSILGYPVISFTDSLTHGGSRENLLGKDPGRDRIEKYSNELRVNSKTPPAFLVHAKDDKAVVWQNSERYYQALLKNNVPAEVYYFEEGGHGFGMNNKTSDVKWMDVLKSWLQKQRFL